MPTKVFTPLLGKRIRVTKVDSCGKLPVAAAVDSVLTTNGFVTVSLSSEIEEGAEIVSKKADGSLCVNEKFSDSFKRFSLEMEFCGVNPSLLSMVANSKTYNDYSANAAGFAVAEGAIEKWFSFELWTGTAGGACLPGVPATGGYLLLPFLAAGVVGDIEIGGEDAVNFSVTGVASKGGNQWGVGRYNVVMNAPATGSPVAAPLPTALDPFDHLLMMTTTVAAPASNDSPTAMPT